MKKIVQCLAMSTWVVLRLAGFGQAEMTGMHHEMAGMETAPKNTNHTMMMSDLKVVSHGGSGTSWLPADELESSFMGTWGDWMWMAHGNLFLRYTSQNSGNSGKRGSANSWDAPNWAMGMAEHKLGEDGLVLLKLMLSLDPLTVGGQGYPLLFQSGETWQGKPLVDRQHPHDLVSELAVLVQQRVWVDECNAFLYLGYPGEPALGPPAFMHRPSAQSDPDAPLGHHWQDSTHVTFGVTTLGLAYRNLKIEGSAFNGREPEENRYDFDPPRLDSFSGRISYNPAAWLALQVSYGFLHSPEALHPAESIHRTTASALHRVSLGGADSLASSLVWGVNHTADGTSEHSFLYESALRWSAFQPYLRAEYVEKSREELDLDPAQFSPAIFPAKTVTLGASCDLVHAAGMIAALGGQVDAFFLPQDLEPLYGPYPYGFIIYLRIYPGNAGPRQAE